MKYFLLAATVTFLFTACTAPVEESTGLPLLKISDNNHFLVNEKGEPFFWLGDTGWLLFKKLNREDAELYLENRKEKGFNVIQVMILHDLDTCINYYGDSAFVHKDISRPLTTPGNDPGDAMEYDYWDHMDYIIGLAEEKGIYMAMVPVWGSNVKGHPIAPDRATAYGTWLAERYRDRSNIIWVNGGDIPGSDSMNFWISLGNALNDNDPNHLVTFHPRGRMQSSTWFHHEPWLDFNMVQSGHRRYDQDDTELNYGEDNWRYIETDYRLSPPRPVLDAEPSYEGIPQGLHDFSQPLWLDRDVRRYAYWSVFAGGFGFTYGNNSVMQFFRPGRDIPSFGATIHWKQELDVPGASQVIHLKELMLSRPFLERVPDQSLVARNQGEKYDYLIATRGKNYAFVYTYTGREMEIAMGKIEGEKLDASWYDPRSGEWTAIGEIENRGTVSFDPPGDREEGNDWVLVLDSKL